jgi:hypothetical protein
MSPGRSEVPHAATATTLAARASSSATGGRRCASPRGSGPRRRCSASGCPQPRARLNRQRNGWFGVHEHSPHAPTESDRTVCRDRRGVIGPDVERGVSSPTCGFLDQGHGHRSTEPLASMAFVHKDAADHPNVRENRTGPRRGENPWGATYLLQHRENLRGLEVHLVDGRVRGQVRVSPGVGKDDRAVRRSQTTERAFRGQSGVNLGRALRARPEPKVFPMRGRVGPPCDALSHLHGNDRRERRGRKASLQKPKPTSASYPVDDGSPGGPVPDQQVSQEPSAPSQGDESGLVGTGL